MAQKGSRERCLPVFFSEYETEENKRKKKNGRKQKKSEPEKNIQTGKRRKKTEEIGSDTVPATPFAKSRFLSPMVRNFAADGTVFSCPETRSSFIGGQNLYQYCAKGSPTTTLKALWCTCIFPLFPLKTSFLVYTKPLFCLLRHLNFQS